MNVRYMLTLHGKVQGVSFRKETLRKAQDLNVTGWVRNTPAGSVTVCAEGAADDVERLGSWCSRGPDQAVVTHFECESGTPTAEFTDFSIQ